MELLRWKARLSVLWVIMAVGTAATLVLALLSPGTIEAVMAGNFGGMQVSEGMLITYAFSFIVPIVLAILCLTMENSKWLNFIFGIIWFLLFIYEIVYHANMEKAVPIGIWLLIVAGFVISAYIVYFAWKWPKEEA